jgi:formyltetrahydrofolate deformylase
MEVDGFILEAAQFGDEDTCHFFQRIHFSCGATTPDYATLCQRFSAEVSERFAMEFNLYDMAHKPKMLVMVSKMGHCLNDLLHRHQTGQLAVDIPAIVSNHPDMRRLADWHEIPFYHLPISPDKKREQEQQIEALIDKHAIDVVVLARYMQILSPELSEKLSGKAINIHHSFLPSFKGAKPYHQAHSRGVKLIGATAHYVTDALDEGPIIEQEVTRVDHTLSATDFVNMGQDIECRVLARAVKYHSEHRVLINGNKTVVF